MDTYELTGVISLSILIIGISIAIFLVFRSVNIWYWKINDSIKNQEEQIRLLKKIAGEKD